MKCAVGLSTADRSGDAIDEVLDKLARALDGARADLAMVFSSMHHANALGALAAKIQERGLGQHLLGCTAESVLGEDREVELDAALCVWSIQLPGTTVRPIRLNWDQSGFRSAPSGLEPESLAGRTVLLLGDPFSFPTEEWLKLLNTAQPAPRVVGGMASGAQAPGKNRLLLDGDLFSQGAVGLVIDGPVAIRTVVSQGCRPIGRHLIVTRVEGNLLHELGRRPAIEVLREQFAELSPEDQAKAQDGLHLGRVINEYQETFKRGDFLVRNVIGANDQGALAITDTVRVGQTVQFHVRDAETADQDLRLLLEAEQTGAQPAGALVFTCNGRGSRLFPGPNHDVDVVHELLGPIPVGGFFAMGEIGPVGGQNYVHGYTASIAIFGPPES
jgi:small ligand-binding sensory domain FIST